MSIVNCIDRTKIIKFLLGGLMPFSIVVMSVVFPMLFAPGNHNTIYTIEFGTFILLLLFYIAYAKSYVADFLGLTEDDEGWCVQCCISFAIPIGIIASLLILNQMDVIKFNIYYILAGAVLYYSIRGQALKYEEHIAYRVILPIGIALAFALIYQATGGEKWCIFLGLLFVIASILLNFRPFKLLYQSDDISDVLTRTNDVDISILKASINELENYIDDNEEIVRNIEDISFPEPKIESNSFLPYGDYITSLANLPKDSAYFASLEQLILSVSPSFSFENWSSHVHFDATKLHDFSREGVQILNDSKDVVHDFVHEHSAEQFNNLLSHITTRLHEVFDSGFFKYGLKFHMEHNIKDAGVYVIKQVGKGAGKGAFDYIKDNIPEDHLAEFADSIDGLEEELKNYMSGLMPTADDVDISMDFDAHFPMITTVIEGIKLMDKYIDGDVDMGRAFTKSATKIAGKGGGALIGAAIGSFIFPFGGTIIGGMIGSWLGGLAANEVNMQKFKELKAQFEEEQRILEEITQSATNIIQDRQREAAYELKDIAVETNKDFRTVSMNSPIRNFNCDVLYLAFCVVVRSYLLELLIQASSQDRKVEISKCIIDISECRKSPKESLLTMISNYRTVNIDNYLTVNSLIDSICAEIMFRQSQLMILQALWINHVRVKYIECMNSILSRSDSVFQSVDEVIENQQKRISNQVAICNDIAEQAKREAKA